MPRLTQDVVTTTTTVVKLAPAIKRKLVTAMRTYLTLKGQEKVIKAALTKGRDTTEGLMEEAGVAQLEIEKMRATLIAPVKKKFNPKKFVALGGNLDHYNQAMEEIPGKPWVKISSMDTPDEEDE